MSDSKTLEQLTGVDDQEKAIKPGDRRALNDALTNQVTITQMHVQGKSSQEKRKELKRVRDPK
jgi:hypothetical protein